MTPEDFTLLVRENANGISFFLNVLLAFVFIRSFLKSRKGVDSWRKSVAMQAAVGLATTFVGTAILRLWVWITLIMDRRGDEFIFLARQYEIPIIALALMITGSLCTVRIMSPEKWGTRFWIAAGLAAVLIPTIVNLWVVWYFGPRAAFPYIKGF